MNIKEIPAGQIYSWLDVLRGRIARFNNILHGKYESQSEDGVNNPEEEYAVFQIENKDDINKEYLIEAHWMKGNNTVSFTRVRGRNQVLTAKDNENALQSLKKKIEEEILDKIHDSIVVKEDSTFDDKGMTYRISFYINDEKETEASRLERKFERSWLLLSRNDLIQAGVKKERALMLTNRQMEKITRIAFRYVNTEYNGEKEELLECAGQAYTDFIIRGAKIEYITLN